MSQYTSLDKKVKKEKEILMEFELNTKDLRQQLNEQLKCLDQKVETEFAILTEIQDYFKKRSEVEMEYSRSLDKIVRNIQAKHKNEKAKRDHWHLYSPYACWQNLLQRCKEESKNHGALSDLYLAVISSRISQIMEDNQRIHKRCKEIGLKCHEEIYKVLNELNTAMKSYHLYHSDFKIAEQKLKLAESQMNKIEIKDKITASKKKIITRTGRRQEKFNRNKLKVEKSRNEYILSLAAANTTIHRYYQEDLNDLIDCSSIGFLPSLSGTLQLYLQGEDRIQYSLQEGIRDMLKSINSLDAKSDKQHFIELYNSAFQLPNKIMFQNHRGDLIATFLPEPEFAEDLSIRHKQLTSRLTALRIENDEIWKTLETAEASLLAMITQACVYNVASLFGASTANTSPAFARNQSLYGNQNSGPSNSIEAIPTSFPGSSSSANLVSEPNQSGQVPNGTVVVSAVSVIKHKTDRQETEEFYLKKFREYLLSGDLISRLQAKFVIIHHALQELGSQVDLNKLTIPSQTPKKKRIIGQGGQSYTGQRPKLFGGSLEEYVLATGQDIPLIMLSTIRIINLYGLHHQGIFRVSGSQIEINEFKNAFEKGEDPLVDVKDSRDINSIAGVLKLYFRELREPLFPIYMFDQLVGLGSKIVANKSVSISNPHPATGPPPNAGEVKPSRESIMQLRDLLGTLSKPVYVAMRYLFAFLNHLSEYSDENMMDPYNLAVCFGPTLLPVPSDRDQVQYQASVNELMRVIITRQEEIFPVRRKGVPAAMFADKGASQPVEYGGNDYYQNEGPFYDKFLVYNEEEEEDDDITSVRGPAGVAAGLSSTHSFSSLASSHGQQATDSAPGTHLVKGGSFKVSGENGKKVVTPTSLSSSGGNKSDREAVAFFPDSEEEEEDDEEISELSATESSELEHLPKYDSGRAQKEVGGGFSASSSLNRRGQRHHSASYKSKRDLVAFARFKFKGRNEKELSFEKGDSLKLKHKVSPEWWKGVLLSTGDEGLVPHRYLVINNESKSGIVPDEKVQTTNSKPPPISTLPITQHSTYKTRSNSDTSMSFSPTGTGQTLVTPLPLDRIPNAAHLQSQTVDRSPKKLGSIFHHHHNTSGKLMINALHAPPKSPLSPVLPNSALQSAFHLMNQKDSLLKPLLFSVQVQVQPGAEPNANSPTKEDAITDPDLGPGAPLAYKGKELGFDSDTLKLPKPRKTSSSTASNSPPQSGSGDERKRSSYRPTNIPDLVCDLPKLNMAPADLKFIDDGGGGGAAANNSNPFTAYETKRDRGRIRTPSPPAPKSSAKSDGGDNVIIPPPLVVNQIIRGFENRMPPAPGPKHNSHPSANNALPPPPTTYLKPAVRIKPAFLKKSSIQFDDEGSDASAPVLLPLAKTPVSDTRPVDVTAGLNSNLAQNRGRYLKHDLTNQYRKRPEETDL